MLASAQRRGFRFRRGLHACAAVLLSLASWLLPLSLSLAESPRMVTVPALAVGHADAAPEGALNYFVIQMEIDPEKRGPTVVFNELPTLWSGSAVGDTLRDGVRQAVRAAAQALGEDEREVEEQRRQQQQRDDVGPVKHPVHAVEPAAERERQDAEEGDRQPEEVQRRLIAGPPRGCWPEYRRHRPLLA